MKQKLSVLIILIFLFSASCGDKNDIEPTEEPGFDVEYTEETIFIEDENAIIAADTVSQTYTFKGSSFSKKPSAGEVILVSGQIMRKVSSVSEDGDNYKIKTTDAALTDVIKNGTISWDISPEWSEVSALKVDGMRVMNLEGQLRSGAIEHTISSGGVDHKIVINPELSEGKINACSFTLQMAKKIAGKATVAFTAEGKVKLPKQKTSIRIKDGELQNFTANNEGITADMTLSLSAAGGTSGEHSLKLPGVALSIPIRFIPTPGGPVPLPIPVSIDIGIQFVSQITIVDAKSSATASSKISMSADAGFEYKGTTVSTSGSLGKEQITDGTFDSAANIGFPIDVQFGVAFPRVGLNIAGQELAYVHTGFTTGSSLNWGPLCKKGYVKMVVEGGYELKVLGQTLAEQKKVFVERQKEAKGDGCP